LFAQLNYARYQVCRIRDRLLTAAYWRIGDLKELFSWQQKQLELRSKILLANWSLILTVAKRTQHYGTDYDDLISEGSMALWRAAEKFDYRRGFKFSTYAWRAISRSFSRLARQNYRYYQHFSVPWDPDLQQDDWNERRQREVTQDWIEQVGMIMQDNLANLSSRERSVIKMRFALNQETYRYDTLRQIGESFGLSKERIRQIQNTALAKLRELKVQL